MGDLFYATYTLNFKEETARARIGPQSGALIRKGNGFADLFPLPAFGDPPLDQQLSALACGSPTFLGQIALSFTRIDANARENETSLFRDAVIPESHWLVPRLTLESQRRVFADLADAARRGFSTFKCKVGVNPAEEGRILEDLVSEFPHQTLRLDANARLSFAQFVSFWTGLPDSVRSRIEFVEDPIPCSEVDWTSLMQSYAVPIARDFEAGQGHGFRVVKPARENVADIEKEESRHSVKMVVTTCLDHPIGQLQAAYVAAHFTACSARPLLTCGLVSHLAYETNAFSERFALNGSRLVPPAGTGWGFNDELEGLPWKAL